MKPMNIKNVLSIGLLLSVFPAFSMITDGSELGRGLLADQETELPHMSDHVAITIDGASSSTDTSPAKSTDGLMSGVEMSIPAELRKVQNKELKKMIIETLVIYGLNGGTACLGYFTGATGISDYAPIPLATALATSWEDAAYYKKTIAFALTMLGAYSSFFVSPKVFFLANQFAALIIMAFAQISAVDYFKKTGKTLSISQIWRYIIPQNKEQFQIYISNFGRKLVGLSSEQQMELIKDEIARMEEGLKKD